MDKDTLSTEESRLVHIILRLSIPQPLKRNYVERLHNAFVYLSDDRKRGASLLSKLCDDLGMVESAPIRGFLDGLEQCDPSPDDLVHPHFGIDIAVICATRDEFSEVLQILDEEEKVNQAEDRLSYAVHCGEIHLSLESPDSSSSLQVVAACQDRMGMADCAILSTIIISRFRPRYLAMTGVCGGRASQSVSVGDLIVPHTIFTYGSGKHTDEGWKPGPMYLEVDPGLIARVAQHSDDIRFEIPKRWSELRRDRRDRPVPNIWTDCLACGDAVIDKRGMIDEKIASIQRKVVGVDMESYALVRAAQMCPGSTQPFVVKGVMDVTEGKTDRDKQYAAFASAQFLRLFAITHALA